VSFAAITPCVASQQVFIVVYFVNGSVRKLLDIPSYLIFILFAGQILGLKNLDFHRIPRNSFHMTVFYLLHG
jgi:hypothetical protein